MSVDQARRKLPLKQMMQEHGDAPADGKWNGFKCPFCGKKGASVFEREGRQWFKCFHNSCPSGTCGDGASWDEVKYMGHKHSLSTGNGGPGKYSDAALAYLKMAGVWKQERLGPTTLPGSRPRKQPLPAPAESLKLKAQSSSLSNSDPDATPDVLAFSVSEEQPAGGTPNPLGAGSSKFKAQSSNANRDEIPPADSSTESTESPERGSENLAVDTRGYAQAADQSSKPPTGANDQAPTMSESGSGVLPAPPRVNASPHSPDCAGSTGGEATISNPAGQTGGESFAVDPMNTPGILHPEDQPSTPKTLGSAPSGAGASFQAPSAPMQSDGVRVNDSPVPVPPVSAGESTIWPASAGSTPGEVDGPRAALNTEPSGNRTRQHVSKAAVPEAGAPNVQPPGDGPPEPPKGGGDGDDDGGEGSPLAALRAFHDGLVLSQEDKQLLWVKRGLTPEICEWAGLKSNTKANRDLLMGLRERFSEDVLVEAGLWLRHDGKAAKPNSQFYGYGIIGKSKDETKGGGFEWGWVYPVLIPYFDVAGRLVLLRPHKGMVRGKSTRLYTVRPAVSGMPRPGAEPGKAPDIALITEGEFKALALAQVFCNAEVAALPGITNAKNYGIMEDLRTWLRGAKLSKAVIGYDNEEKGDPKLVSYKEDKKKRYESQRWARYLAIVLSREGFEGKVALLPKEWRDEKGKADWDGCLAWWIQEVGGTQSTPSTPLPDRGGEGARDVSDAKSPGATWKRVAARVRAEFVKVLRGARKANDFKQSGLFDTDEERIIQNGVERLFYTPQLPIGGDKELTTAIKLEKYLRKGNGTTRDWHVVKRVAQGFRDCLGRYYILKPAMGKSDLTWWLEKRQSHAENGGDPDGEVDFRWICDTVLAGAPEWITDFYVKPFFVLRRQDGTRLRLVRLMGVWDKTGHSPLVELPSADFAQPSRFREWLLNCGGFTWKAGERELNNLQADIAHDLAFMDIKEVPLRGYHKDSGLWFFKDVAIAPDGREIRPEEGEIFWYEGTGYKLAEKDQEGEELCQGEPLMRPRVPVPVKKDQSEREALRLRFDELAQNMYETVGGFDGFLVLGMFLSCGAAPEIYRTHNACPGLWLHGEKGQGKSSIAYWMLKLWGFDKDSGIPLPDSTKAGLSIGLQQYGNLPMWLEEYQPEAPAWLIEKIKNIYNRETGLKKNFDDGSRRILSMGVVTGIATCRDAQVRSRYAHVQIAEKSRLASHFDWFQAESKEFFFIGRHVLRNRKEYVRVTLEVLKEWIGSPEMAQVDPRARLVHGVAYAAFVSMLMLLESPLKATLGEYRTFLIGHCVTEVGKIQSQVNVNQFWSDLLTAFNTGEFGNSYADWKAFFHVKATPVENAPLAPTQTEWINYKLYLRIGEILNVLNKELRKRGSSVALTQNDLHDQMSKRPYFVAGEHKQRFGSKTAASRCWCIDVDKHDMGYQFTTDEELERSKIKDVETGYLFAREDWDDPRKGDLFALIEKVIKRDEEI